MIKIDNPILSLRIALAFSLHRMGIITMVVPSLVSSGIVRRFNSLLSPWSLTSHCPDFFPIGLITPFSILFLFLIFLLLVHIPHHNYFIRHRFILEDQGFLEKRELTNSLFYLHHLPSWFSYIIHSINTCGTEIRMHLKAHNIPQSALKWKINYCYLNSHYNTLTF